MRKVLLASLIIFLVIPTALSQGDPDKSNATLQETLDWISGKLSKSYQYPMYFDNGYTITGFNPISFSGCQITWQTTSSQEKQGGKKEIGLREFKVSLGDLEPTKIEVNKYEFKDNHSWYVHFSTFNNKRVISMTRTINGVQERVRMRDTFTLNFRGEDEELARRMAKAFSHAITLCGGRKEPF